MTCGCANGPASNAAGENTSPCPCGNCPSPVDEQALVLVVWRAAATQSDVPLAEAKGLEPPEVRSVGHIVIYNTIKLVLASSILEGKFAMDVLVIPADWVISVVRLESTHDLLDPKETQ